IWSALQDREGNYWFGTANGVSILTGECFINYSEKDGLANNLVSAIFEDSKGNIWIGSWEGGVSKFDTKTTPGTSGARFKIITQSQGLARNNAFSIMEDSKGNLWFGTRGGGVSKLIVNENRFVNYSLNEGLTDNRVYSIIEDKHGTIWLGTGNGITKIQGNNILRPEELNDEINSTVWCILQDNKGNYWFATDSGAVLYAGPFGDRINVQHFSDKNNFVNARVRTILQDNQGNMWFGTDKGVFIYDNKKIKKSSRQLAGDLGGLFETINQTHGLNSNKIYSMVFDDKGFLWLGTNKGLNRVDVDKYNNTKEISIKHYGLQEGFIGLECNSNAAFKDSRGKLWFGTVHGVTIYDADLDKENSVEPVTKINNIRLFFEDTDWKHYADSIELKAQLPIGLQLTYNKNHLTFAFTGVSLTIPQKVKYQFMLEGFDENYNPVTQKDEITYANIPPGNFTFKVKACNNDGLWNKVPATFSFTIIPPFWQTWWFRVIAFLAVAGAVWFFFYIRFNRLKAKNELDKKIIELERDALRAQMNPHFIFNSLNSIQSFISDNDNEAAARFLAKFARLIRLILDNSRHPNIPFINEVQTLQYYLELEKMRFKDKFEFSIDADPDIDQDLMSIPPMLIQPYVENGILHGVIPKKGGGTINIRFKLNDDVILCIIQDDGIGREKAAELKDQHPSPGMKHDPVGMLVTKERLEILNASISKGSVHIIDLKDDDGKPEGTRVEVSIPYIENA
ncbi:MAG: histidine kinase, partial [Bacteroidetes bacterium]|nr:histidine kinase [Bacteroidota bacterium]